MKQKMQYIQTLKQTLKLNQKLLKSLDFLTDNIDDINKVVQQVLETNPFLELKSPKNYDTQQFIESISNKRSLKDDLYLQLSACTRPYNKDLMDYLIESLDDNGFLSYPIDQYITDLDIDRKTLDSHLDILRSFEPNGVGAADAIDSIIIQLKNNNKTKSYTLFRDYQDVILTQNYSLIKQKTGLKKEEIDHLFYEIRSCNPFPCNMYSSFQDDYISPDILIEVEDSNIIITPINQPELIVNDLLYEKVKNDENMKSYFNEAHFLIENLTKRNQTVLFVANALVDIQSGYFLYDDELYPCTLSQLASETGFHESTISRTLNNKYYSFNGEIYPLKQLLVSQTASGDSSDSIKKAIVELVDSEDKEHPLSDNQILKKLEELELHCSRRVIVKYRQQLNIPSSTKRKILLK
ncbi:MAG: RNA polymerase sigma-54 factor [Catenibacterium mitsuokai]